MKGIALLVVLLLCCSKSNASKRTGNIPSEAQQKSFSVCVWTCSEQSNEAENINGTQLQLAQTEADKRNFQSKVLVK